MGAAIRQLEVGTMLTAKDWVEGAGLAAAVQNLNPAGEAVSGVL